MWDDLKTLRGARIAGLFGNGRAAAFSVTFDGMLFDYSKTSLTEEARSGLIRLAQERGVEARRAAMFSGKAINETEGRAVLHTALRALSGGPVMVDGHDVMPDVRAGLARMEQFAEDVRSGRFEAAGGSVTDVINIGIGGSHLLIIKTG